MSSRAAPGLLPLALLLCLAAPPVPAQDAAAVKKAAPKVAPARKALKNEAKGLALAQDTVEQITAGQLDVAARVLTGTADCEFGQTVDVQAHSGQQGLFQLHFKNATYTMVPQETTTGAVRLEDKKNGIVWIQIPVKSMLMNAKLGQRMVDACLHGEQKAAVRAVEAAAQSAAAPAPATAASR